MAPPMAADALGAERISMAELLTELAGSWGDAPADVGLVELAGGMWSPIAHDGDGLDLTRALAPDMVVIVADAGLGTINSIRPAVDAALRDRSDRDAAQPLRGLDRPAPAQPGVAPRTRRIDVVTDVRSLAAVI